MKLKKLLIILIAQYFFYPFYLDAISNTVQQLFTFGAMFLYAFLHLNYFVYMTKSVLNKNRVILISLVLYFLVFISTILIPILYGTNQFSYTYVHVRYILYSILFFILVGIIVIEIKPKNVFNETLRIFISATRNYVLVSIVFIIFPTIKNTWINIIHLQPRTLELINSPSYLTRVGWTGYSGFSITVYCTIAVIFCMYMISEHIRINNKLSFTLLVNLIFLLLGNSFYGRAGLLMSILVVGLSIISICLNFKKIRFLLTFILFSLISILLVFVLKEYIPALDDWFEWMMQPFVSILETGSIQTTSTDVLWDMWFIPDWRTILFGNGFYFSPLPINNYYMSTDVGYLRSVLFFGLFLSSAFYLLPVIALSSLFNHDFKRNDILLYVLLILTIGILEVKAETVSLIMPILVMVIISRNYIKYNDKRRIIHE